MKCPHCSKKIEISNELYDDTPGAVFIIRSTGYDSPVVWPASLGLIKRKGCVEFGIAYVGCEAEESNLKITFEIDECKSIYGDYPEEEEAWLVKPNKDSYSWLEVSEDIPFSVF